jgi:hypothetical protein
MRPKSDPKSRAAAIKDLKASRALQPSELEDRRQYALKTKEKAAALLADSTEPSGYLGGVARDAFSLCASSLIVGDAWSDGALRDLTTAMEFTEVIARWHEAAGSPKQDTDNYTADASNTVLAHSVWTAFIRAHLGQWDRACWMAKYLLGYIKGRAFRVPDPQMEGDYLALFGLLLQVMTDEAWPAALPAGLGPYQELIEARRDPVRSARALVAVADLRMARQLGYAQADDARGLPPSAPPSLMGKFEFIAMPAELWAIRAIARRLDGLELSLDADHPWLRAGFAQPPAAPLPAIDDALLQAVRGHLREQ